MQSKFGRHLVVAFVMAAFTTSMLSVSFYIPFFGLILAALAGIPGLFAALTLGNIWFALYSVLTIVGIAIFSGWGMGVLSIPLLLIPVGLLAFCIKRCLEPFRAVALTLLISISFSFWLWTIAPLFGEIGVKIWQLRSAFERQAVLLELQLRKTASQSLAGEKKATLQSEESPFTKQKLEFGSKNVSEKNVEDFHPLIVDDTSEMLIRRFREWMEFVALLVPITFLFNWYFFALVVMYYGAEFLAPRHGFKVKPLPPFANWQFDWRLIWLFIGGWLLCSFAYVVPQPFLRHVVGVLGANCLAISNILYFIAGFSLLFYFFEKNAIGFANRICISILAIIMAQIVVWIGIADVWLDFRTPPKFNQNNDTSSFFDSF